MAAVWAGTNERTGKRVALKVILRSLAATSLAQGLFHSEALAASLVNHPNVVTVFDVIEHEGLACIVMELLEGEPLSSYIARKGVLSVNEVGMLLLPAMRGVAAANAQGVIHRDLKPQNIFICMEPDGRIVTTKVLDFGISVMLERGTDASGGPASAMGTPAYMSPEHILGLPDIDGRADVYGFGVLLYESLTGQMPFPGEPSPALFDRILYRPAVPITTRRPDLPTVLVRIIEKAMAKDRDQRFSDVNAMLLALEDELLPPTPAPRLLTPQAGVPSFAPHHPLADPDALATEAVVDKEPAGQHLGTRMLFAFPMESEGKESAAHEEPDGGSRSGTEELAPPPPTDRKTALPARRPSLRRRRFLGTGKLSALRGWGGLAGAGFAVAMGFFTVWMAMPGARKVQTRAPTPIANATPPAREPVLQPSVPAVVSTATVDQVLVDHPLVSQSPPAPTVLAASQAAARPMPSLVTPSRSSVAVGRTSNDFPPRRQPPGRAKAGRVSSAREAGASEAFSAPRAGRLSVDDF